MIKSVMLLFSVICIGFSVFALTKESEVILKKNPKYAARFKKEVEKVFAFNKKFQSPDVLKECAKREAASDCFLKQLQAMHEKEKFSMTGLMLALAQGSSLVLEEKDQQRKEDPKISNSKLSHTSHKKQAQMAISILMLACSHATAKDWGFKNAELLKFEDDATAETFTEFDKVTIDEIEQTRKYSELDGAALKVEFEAAKACRKNK